MLSSITIAGFKRFDRVSLDLGKLTVLAGINGSGKTSLIQAILLLAESSRGRQTARLNGPFGLELGTADDVRNWKTDGPIQISVSDVDGHIYSWAFSVPSENALFLNQVSTPDPMPFPFKDVPRTFTYLSAERLGPRANVRPSALPPEKLEVGTRGEHCAQFLAIFGNSKFFTEKRMHPDAVESDAPLFKYQVERWLSEIARPIEIDAIENAEVMAAALRFRSPGGDWVRATNMGFGVSYALPVVVGGLAAMEGGLFLVENPEAHLHPAGQSRMGAFLAWLAGHGVQVIVETHSDHVLNGIRLAVSKLEYMPAEDALVHYFGIDDDSVAPIQKLEFTRQGSLSHWPSGFFDQYQVDVASLGRIRRNQN